MITIALAADHRGYLLKEEIKKQTNIGQHALKYIDVGTDSIGRTNYALFAYKALALVREKKADYALLLCGTGIGMCMAANRWRGMRAAVAHTPELAARAKQEDNINILVLPADYITQETALTIIKSWLDAHFKAGVYQERIDVIDQFGS